ncbi:MAG: GNAT family N-acetyltransferase [Hespellia sp.]|nr:GNAT family N-acetyltransferase [Hespellia sp.]
MTKNEVRLRYSFRCITEKETEEAIAIEQICFPPNEACSAKSMRTRILAVPELFLVAIDEKLGKIAGFLNGIATNETVFRDEFFSDISLYDPEGQTLMILGLDVIPEYRGQGLATAIMSEYLERAAKMEKKLVLLTCLEDKVNMYKKMGFQDKGMSGSTWGGEQWHEMSYEL